MDGNIFFILFSFVWFILNLWYERKKNDPNGVYGLLPRSMQDSKRIHRSYKKNETEIYFITNQINVGYVKKKHHMQTNWGNRSLFMFWSNLHCNLSDYDWRLKLSNCVTDTKSRKSWQNKIYKRINLRFLWFRWKIKNIFKSYHYLSPNIRV